MGNANNWSSAVTIPDVDEGVIMRAWTWFEELLKTDPRLSAGAFVLIELMQKVRIAI